MDAHVEGGVGGAPSESRDWSALPPLILASIVNHLESDGNKEDLQATRGTCRRWSKSATQQFSSWSVRGPVHLFEWAYLRGTLYMLCPVAARMALVLSNRVTPEALHHMCRDLAWWSRLREVGVVAMRPCGTGLFGPGLSTAALEGLSALLGLRALSTEGVESDTALHAVLSCPQLTRLAFRSRRSPISPVCRINSRFLELIATSQAAISEGRPPPPPPTQRKRTGQHQGAAGANAGGAAAGGGGGGGGAGGVGPGGGEGAGDGGEGGGQLGDGPREQEQEEEEGPMLDEHQQALLQLQQLYRGDDAMEELAAECGTAPLHSGAVGGGPFGGPGAAACGCGAGAAASNGNGAVPYPYGGLRHLELDYDGFGLDDLQLDAGAAGSTSGSDVYSAARVGALLAALPRLQHLVAPRLALDETLAGQLAAARHLTELHACIHDAGARRPARGPGPGPGLGQARGGSRAVAVLQALARAPGAGPGPAPALPPAPPGPIPPMFLAQPPSLGDTRLGTGMVQSAPLSGAMAAAAAADQDAGPSSYHRSRSGLPFGSGAAAAATGAGACYGPPPCPGRPLLHLQLNCCNGDTPAVLLEAMVPLVPRLRSLSLAHPAMSPNHMTAVGQLTSLQRLALLLTHSQADAAGVSIAAMERAQARQMQQRRQRRRTIALALARGAGPLHMRHELEDVRWRGPYGVQDDGDDDEDVLFGGRPHRAGRIPNGGRYGPPWDGGDEDIGGLGLDVGTGDGYALGMGAGSESLGLDEEERRTGLGLSALRNLRELKELHIKGSLEPVRLSVRVAAGLAALERQGSVEAVAAAAAAARMAGDMGGMFAAVQQQLQQQVQQPELRLQQHLQQQIALLQEAERTMSAATAAAAAAHGAGGPAGPAVGGGGGGGGGAFSAPTSSANAGLLCGLLGSRRRSEDGNGPEAQPNGGGGLGLELAAAAALSPFHSVSGMPWSAAAGEQQQQQPAPMEVGASGPQLPGLPPLPPLPPPPQQQEPSQLAQTPSSQLQALAATLATAAAEWEGADAATGMELLADMADGDPWAGERYLDMYGIPYFGLGGDEMGPDGLLPPLPPAWRRGQDGGRAVWDPRGEARGRGGGEEGEERDRARAVAAWHAARRRRQQQQQQAGEPWWLRGNGEDGAGQGSGLGAAAAAGEAGGGLPGSGMGLPTLTVISGSGGGASEATAGAIAAAAAPTAGTRRRGGGAEGPAGGQGASTGGGEARSPGGRQARKWLPSWLFCGPGNASEPNEVDGERESGAEGRRPRRGTVKPSGDNSSSSSSGSSSSSSSESESGRGSISGAVGGGSGGESNGSGSVLELGGGGAASGRGDSMDIDTSVGQGSAPMSLGTSPMVELPVGVHAGAQGPPTGAAAAAGSGGGGAAAAAMSGPSLAAPSWTQLQQPQQQHQDGPQAGGARCVPAVSAAALALAAAAADGSDTSDGPALSGSRGRRPMRKTARGRTGNSQPAQALPQVQAQPQEAQPAVQQQPVRAGLVPPQQQQPQPPPHRPPPPAHAVPRVAQALQELTRERQMLRRAVLPLGRDDLTALREHHGATLEVLSLHYVRTPPDLVALLAKALPKLHTLSLRWANDMEELPSALHPHQQHHLQPWGDISRPVAQDGELVWDGSGGGRGGGPGYVELSVLPPRLRSLELGGPMVLRVAARDPAAAGGSSSVPAPLWTQLRRLVLSDGFNTPNGSCGLLLRLCTGLTELQLVRTRGGSEADLEALRGLTHLRTLVFESEVCEDLLRRMALARAIRHVADLTNLRELRWDVPEPHIRRRTGTGPEEVLADASRELCHSLLRLTSLTRLSLLSLPSCRQLLPRLEELQALRHMPILELSPS